MTVAAGRTQRARAEGVRGQIYKLPTAVAFDKTAACLFVFGGKKKKNRQVNGSLHALPRETAGSSSRPGFLAFGRRSEAILTLSNQALPMTVHSLTDSLTQTLVTGQTDCRFLGAAIKNPSSVKRQKKFPSKSWIYTCRCRRRLVRSKGSHWRDCSERYLK